MGPIGKMGLQGRRTNSTRWEPEADGSLPLAAGGRVSRKGAGLARSVDANNPCGDGVEAAHPSNPPGAPEGLKDVNC